MLRQSASNLRGWTGASPDLSDPLLRCSLLEHQAELRQHRANPSSVTKSADGRKHLTEHLDQDGRLLQVHKGVYASGAVLENEFTVEDSYDSMGRMLRRDNGTEVATFVWDGWDLLSEETDSVVTTYLLLDGLV